MKISQIILFTVFFGISLYYFSPQFHYDFKQKSEEIKTGIEKSQFDSDALNSTIIASNPENFENSTVKTIGKVESLSNNNFGYEERIETNSCDFEAFTETAVINATVKYNKVCSCNALTGTSTKMQNQGEMTVNSCEDYSEGLGVDYSSCIPNSTRKSYYLECNQVLEEFEQ